MKTVDNVATLNTHKATYSSKGKRVCMLFVEAPARTEARLMRDATALVEAGFDVTIVDVEKERTRSAQEDFKGVHLQHIFLASWYTPTRFKPWFLVKLGMVLFLSTLKLLQVPTDIYHVHVEKAFMAGLIASQLRRKPLIFDVPDLPLSDPHLTRWRALTAIAARFLALLVPLCARIITASPLYAEVIRKTYPRPDTSVIRNVPVYRKVEKTNRIREYLGLSDQVRIALYQGNLQPDRELDRLVYAAAYLDPNIVIVMMGKGFRGVPDQLRALMEREGVAERVKIIPAVPYEELLDWTASADIGLTLFSPGYSLSIRYTLPNKLFEYLMAGLPVLSLELDAIAEVLHNYQVGEVLSSQEPAAIGDGINRLLADEEALDRMRENALRIAADEFNWDKECQHLIEIYRQILRLDDESESKA